MSSVDNNPVAASTTKDSVFAKIISGSISFYVLTVLVAIPYFNWKYAKKAGFFEWFCCGEIVPTLKAAIWPYYAFRSPPSEEWSQKELDQLEEFGKLINGHKNWQEATVLVNISGDFSPLKELAQRDVERARRIDPAVLKKVHAELPAAFENKYIRSLEELIQMIDARKHNPRVEELAWDWQEWFKKHRAEFNLPRPE